MNELQHYGVKGMKWGVRKQRNPSPKQRKKLDEATKKKIKKAVVITATVSAMALAAYLIYRYRNTTLDKTIPSGKTMQRMSRWMEEPLKDKVYASHLRGDNKKYRTWFAAEKGANYVKEIVADKDIKIAGNKACLSAFKEVIDNDPEMRRQFGSKDIRSAYNTFNRSTLFSPDTNDKQLADSFFKKLSEKGYSAVRDRNDQMYSGIKSPIILFNVKENLSVKSTTKLTRDDIPKKYKDIYDATTKVIPKYKEDEWWKAGDNMTDTLQHYGVKGMKWGVRKKRETSDRSAKRAELVKKAKTKAVQGAYAVGAHVNPRELKYSAKRKLTRHTTDDTAVADLVRAQVKVTGKLPTNEKLINAINKEGIKVHKEAVYDNIDQTDIKRLKKYTDAAVYSRAVNSYLAIGEPQSVADKAQALKATISKNSIENVTVYRSTNMMFSTDGLSKKMNEYGPDELPKVFDSFEKNFKGKSFKENRIYSTSTSPSFAIDTWRKVNPTAAKTYNTYLVIDCKGTPGVLADGRTSAGKKLVNTRSNQEGILAPNKMTYRKLAWDEERGMFAVYLDAE